VMTEDPLRPFYLRLRSRERIILYQRDIL
jgi:hypothetical protein